MADDCFLVSNSSLSKCHSPFTHNWALFCPFTAVGQVTADELRYILGIHSPSVLGPPQLTPELLLEARDLWLSHARPPRMEAVCLS